MESENAPDWAFTVRQPDGVVERLMRERFDQFAAKRYKHDPNANWGTAVTRLMRAAQLPSTPNQPPAFEFLPALQRVSKDWTRGEEFNILTRLYASGMLPRLPPMMFDAHGGDGPFIRIDGTEREKLPGVHHIINAVKDQQSNTPLIRYAISDNAVVSPTFGVYNGTIPPLGPHEAVRVAWDTAELIDFVDVNLKAPYQQQATAYIRVCLQTLTALRPIILALAPDRRAALGLAIRDALVDDMAGYHLSVQDFNGDEATVNMSALLADAPFGAVSIVPVLSGAVGWLKGHPFDGIMFDTKSDPDGAVALQFAAADQEEDGPVVVREVSWWDVVELCEMMQRGSVVAIPYTDPDFPPPPMIPAAGHADMVDLAA